MQAEIDELKEKNETLKKEKRTLKQANTRMKKQKESLKKTKKETKGALQMKCKVTEKAAQKLQKENEEYKVLLEEKEQQMAHDEERYRKLAKQNLLFKQDIVESSRVDYQLSDETILDAIGYAYAAIWDCFWGIIRKKDRGQSTSQNFESRSTPYSGVIDVSLAQWQEDLDTYVPNHRDNTNKDKLHLCIATVGRVLTAVVNAELVFGSPCTDQIEAATACWRQMPGKYTLTAKSRKSRDD